MKSMSPVVLVSDASMPGLAWGERRNSARGWAQELQGLVEAGAGKALRIEVEDDRQASNRQGQLRTKARKLNIKIEFARADKFLFVRIAGAQKTAAHTVAIADQSETDGRALVDLVWSVLEGRTRWNNLPSICGAVLAMEAKAAKSATNKDVRLALFQLCKSGTVLERNEEGVPTWRAKKVA